MTLLNHYILNRYRILYVPELKMTMKINYCIQNVKCCWLTEMLSHVFPLYVPPKLNPIIHRPWRFNPIFHTYENGKHTYLVFSNTSQSWRIAYLINALRYSLDINSALPILVRIRDSLFWWKKNVYCHE